MNSESDFIRAEIPDLYEIVRNECWLEAERRGHPVAPQDERVRQRVADIILGGAGAALRKKHTLGSTDPGA